MKERYGNAVTAVTSGGKASCCGSSASAGVSGIDPITRDLYDAIEVGSIPEAAVLASFGCGNPTALTDLREGEVVLDLGSGAVRFLRV